MDLSVQCNLLLLAPLHQSPLFVSLSPQNQTMKPIFLFFSLLLAVSVAAQTPQNGLDFDNVDDFVSVPAASAVIANQPAFSMAGWVFLANPSPGFPNFDGVMGFRNDLNADFYILHLNATTFECRLRPSTGGAITMTSATAQLNQWQHVALVYTGSQLQFYHNGTLATTLAATGTITNAAVDFNIGRLPFQTTPFLLQGQMDEVGLWSRALTAAEVNCLWKQKINPAMNGLAAYWPMNQGTAGGNNGAQFFLDDVIGTLDGTMNGFALAGTSSNFVAGINRTGSRVDTICPGDSLVVNGQAYKNPGVYQIILPGGEGCDSSMELSLAWRLLNTGISLSGFTLRAADSTASQYRWINCATNTVVSGATGRSFTATANGSYAVIITTPNGCTDTSVCLTVSGVSVAENDWAAGIKVYPNPGNTLYIDLPENVTQAAVQVLDLSGRVQFSELLKIDNNELNTSTLNTGMYIISIENNGKKIHRPWIKQ